MKRGELWYDSPRHKSPTGKLHIGGLRTALFNYLFAKKNNGKFILRIEDTDQDRFDKDAESYIIKSLKWAGILPDFGPHNPENGVKYRQTERLDIYHNHIKRLLDAGLAYYAFDAKDSIDNMKSKFGKYACYNYDTRLYMCNSLTLSKDELKDKLDNGAPYVIRIKIDPNKDITFNDIIRGPITINTNQLDDKVLIKSDGIPTYHFANFIDDYLMGVTHVIRGEEWLPSTPLHVLLYNYMGWKVPEFAHLPLILSPDGKGKLSKRSAAKYGFSVFPLSCKAWDDDKKMDIDFIGWKDAGYDAAPFMNFLSLIGWNPGNDIEKMSMDEMIKLFDLKDVNKTGARFDHIKAKSFNMDHMRNNIPNACLLKFISYDTSGYDAVKIDMIVDVCKNRAESKKDLDTYAKIFFQDITSSDCSKYTHEYKLVMSELLISDINFDSIELIKSKLNDICIQNNIKLGKIMPGLRNAVAGGIPGPDLITSMFILGKKRTFNRIKSTI